MNLKHRGQIFLVILMAAIVLATAANAGLRCNLCGREINGSYYRTTSGYTYCPDCEARYPLCSQCGRLTREPLKVNGRDLCAQCYAKLERCSLCSQPILGNYTIYPELNLKICDKCERDKPRCDRCGIPARRLIATGDYKICENCASKTEVCHSCGAALLKDYSFFEGNREYKYCFQCIKKYPACSNCGAPSGAYSTRLDDGRYLCSECRQAAYFNAGLVTPIKKKVVSHLESQMGMKVLHFMEFSLEGQGFLRQKAKDLHADLNGLFYRKGDKFNIYVLYGLREKDLISVIAHEVSHAWEAENCSKNLPLEDQEGFAQWVAYKTLIYYGYDDFARLMTEGESAYVSGLNKMLKIESRGGSTAVFNHIKSKKQPVNQ